MALVRLLAATCVVSCRLVLSSDHSSLPQHNSPVRKRQVVFPIRDTDSDSEYEGLKAASPEDLSMTRRGQAGARRYVPRGDGRGT